MMHAIPALALVLTILCPAALALARDYHVSTAACANDGNDGMSAVCGAKGHGPWRDIDQGLKRLAPGDTLYLAPGRYVQHWVSMDRSGAAGRPITLAASKPGTAVLDGEGAPDGACGLFIEKDAAHLVIDGLVVQNMPGNGIASDEETSQVFEDITIRRCTLRGNGLSGVELAAVQGFVVEDVHAVDNGYYGIHIIGSLDGLLASSQGEIRGCVCSGHTGPQGHGLAINQGQDIRVIRCKASHNRIHGFDVSDWPKRGLLSERVTFLDNLAVDNGKAGFAVNSDSSRVRFVRNLAWKNGAAWASDKLAPGFWCYEGCRDVAWINNTSVGNSNSGFHVEGAAGLYDGRSPATSLTFINNIGWNNGQAQWKETFGLWVSKAGWRLTLKNNNFGAQAPSDSLIVGLEMTGDRGQTFTAADLEAGRLPHENVSRNPGFRNPEGGDFSLRQSSPMLDAGAPAGQQHCGRAPDIGAFELCF